MTTDTLASRIAAASMDEQIRMTIDIALRRLDQMDVVGEMYVEIKQARTWLAAQPQKPPMSAEQLRQGEAWALAVKADAKYAQFAHGVTAQPQKDATNMDIREAVRILLESSYSENPDTYGVAESIAGEWLAGQPQRMDANTVRESWNRISRYLAERGADVPDHDDIMIVTAALAAPAPTDTQEEA